VSAQPFDVGRFEGILRTTSFGRNLLFEPSVGSTMDVARDAAAHGAAEGTLALADEQTAGRGRLGRGWVTPPALNLASTLVLRPGSDRLMRQIAMMAPLAIARCVTELSALRAEIKWPNDVQVRGKKLAGVLIELVDPGDGRVVALVGAGINVNFDPVRHPEIQDIATSMAAETGRSWERESVLAAYLAHFEQIYAEAYRGRSPRSAWLEQLNTIGRLVRVQRPGAAFDGVAEDVDDDGSLIVRTDAGEVVVVEAGDVTLRE
jgi:BirA family biotin operon repressor/biotin-[acetyl-CoA-carboxylase] ligase